MMPAPEPGLVVGYAFLWHAEQQVGRQEGRKDRPCALVLSRKRGDGAAEVVVAPITHARPEPGRYAVLLPAQVKHGLGLDDAESWVVCDELNRFVWPGPDLRPVRRDAPGVFAYGTLPASLLRRIVATVLEARTAQRLRLVPRPE